MTLRLLIVNRNTSAEITHLIVAQARVNASPGTEVETATAEFGVRVIGSPAENAIAQHAVLEAIARYVAGAHAVLFAVSLDTALGAARQALDVPVESQP